MNNQLTKKQSILQSVFDDVNEINWSTNTVRQKALTFITIQFNRFINNYGTLMNYTPMSNEYWTKCIKGKTDHMREIKSKLISNEILESLTGQWNKDKRVISYKINTKYIINNNNIFTNTLLADPFSNTLENKEIEELNKYILNNLNKITIKGSASNEKGSTSLEERIFELSRLYRKGSASNEKGSTSLEERIFELSRLYRKGSANNDMDNIVYVNNEIEDEFINLILDDKNYRYSKSKAIEFTKSMNVDLIKYDNKFYTYKIEEFMLYKQKELELIYHRQIFNLENKIFYSSRNETNYRLDHNLTNLKKELFDYILFEGESLKELDIKNAQFTILSNLTNDLDEDFIIQAQNGTLYEYIGKQLNITRKEAKLFMFNIAFDKVKKHQDIIRNIFPKTMLFIDTYKNENGYKNFSNLLQCAESKLMIDGLLKHLYDLGYNVFSVHDSIRFKESQTEELSLIIKMYFLKHNFKCTMNTETNIDIEIITPNESKEESNMINQEEKESSLEETYTKNDYIEILEQIRIGFFKQKHTIHLKENILDELVKRQPKNKKELTKIIKNIKI